MYRVVKCSKVDYDTDPYLVSAEEPKDSSSNKQTPTLKEIKAEIELRELLAKQKAENILKEARLKADVLIEEAKQQAKQIRINAQEKGRAEGWEEGHQEAEEICTNKLKEIEKLQNDIEKNFQKELEKIEQQIVGISIMVSEKVIGIKLEQDDSILVKVVKDAVKRLKVEGIAIVEVSRNNIKKLINQATPEDISWKENETLNDENVLVHTEAGIVDVSIDKQIDKIKSVLLQNNCR